MADALFQTLGNFGGKFFVASVTNHSLDANNDGLAAVFETFSADPITHLGFRYGSRTGTPPTYIIALEGVDGSGLPDGTVKGGGSPASATFTPPASTAWDGTWQWVALSNSYTPTRSELLAATIRYSSGTVDASNFSSITRDLSGLAAANQGIPYELTLTAGTWAKRTSDGPVFGYRTASGRHGCIATGLFQTNVTTTGNRQALGFVLPSGHGSTFKLAGITAQMRVSAAAGSFVFGLWDSSGTMIQDKTYDADQFGNTGGSNSRSLCLFDESSLTALNYGTTYYVGFQSVSSSAVGMRGYQLSEAADRSAYPNGTNMWLGTWNGSAWSDDTTVIPICELILSDVTVPSGGGGAFIIGG